MHDVIAANEGQIRGLLKAPYMRRLRRVKQLGFVSQSFLSAEHNRYAHALGTMHMMRGITTRLQQRDADPQFWPCVASEVYKTFKFLKF